jgi:hypothetical protein
VRTRRFGAVAFALAFVFALGCSQASTPPVPRAQETSVTIPLTVIQNPYYKTYRATVTLAVGGAKPLPFGFDTGSTGLHVFADARLEAAGSGVRCTHTPTSVVYGNPPRIIFSGVVCYAPLHFANFTTPNAVPIAYLTSASCPTNNPSCKIPNLHSEKSMGGYGVFGAGLTGIMSANGAVPNPILTLPGRLGSIYNVVLTERSGALILGGSEPAQSIEFDLNPGRVSGEHYSLATTHLWIDDHPVRRFLLISFDTGNGVPWIHDAQNDVARIGAIPELNGAVTPGTRVGFAPAGDFRAATWVVAGTTFADTIKIVDEPDSAPITNTGITAFFGRVFTYDETRGVIAVAPAP